MHEVPTVKVKPQSEEQGEYVLINAEDFDPELHEHFDAPKPKAAKK